MTEAKIEDSYKMNYFLTIFFFVICATSATVRAQQCNIPGYYWRDFTGEIPLDAIHGGTDINGKPIYIGQVFNLKFLIPAKIYTNDRQAYYEYGGKEFSQTNNVKILCALRPNDFEWVKTNNNDIKLLTNKQLVIGGYEPGCTTYIGRARQDGEILVGKALADNLPQFAGLHVTSGGKGRRHTAFEVLAYSPTYLDVRTVWDD